MKSFIKLVSANVVALFIALGVLGVLGFIFTAMLLALPTAVSTQATIIEEDSVLVVNLSVNISDAPPEDTLLSSVNDVMSGSGVGQLYLLELIDAIDQAGEDDRIAALFLHGSFVSQNYGSGYAALNELRRALETFKKSGKPVYGYVVSPSLKDYYVLSVANRLYLNPFGLLTFNGMASQMVFLGQALERYGVGVQATKAGKYKSAVEMFTQEKMSDANRYQVEELLKNLWGTLLHDVAAGRALEVDTLEALANEPGFFTAEDAQTHGLVDAVAYLDEVITALQDAHGSDADGNTFKQVSLTQYIQTIGLSKRNGFESDQQIAVVYAEGDIVNGEGLGGQIGGDQLARQIRALRKDDTVKGMVLRVNSPGGSAVAAEVIQREIREFNAVKPVVVSMGSFAASGGYWIAANSEKIYAEPSTITGSIGVFGILFNIGDIANRWGLTFDGAKTSEFSDIYTYARPKTEAEMTIIQQFTDLIYDEFLHKVAAGRDLPLEQVEAIAQGRVWTGVDALNVGLVDELGGLLDAIEHVVELAAVGSDWKLKQVPEKQDWVTQLESLLEQHGNVRAAAPQQQDIVSQVVHAVQQELATLRAYNDPKGVYARMPFELILR